MKNSCLITTLTASLLLFQLNFASAQSVDIDSILINGSIKKHMQYSDFLRTGIEIDSIIKPDPGDHISGTDTRIFIGKSMFFVDSCNRCDARSVWFDKILSVNLGKYQVTGSTTLDDLKRMFPASCQSTKSINHYDFKGIILETCSLGVRDSTGRLWDMRILFFLKDNKLEGLDFWEPI